MTTVGYARVSSVGQDLEVQLEKLARGCDKIFKEKRSGMDAGRPELKRCLEYLREGDTLLVLWNTAGLTHLSGHDCRHTNRGPA